MEKTLNDFKLFSETHQLYFEILEWKDMMHR